MPKPESGLASATPKLRSKPAPPQPGYWRRLPLSLRYGLPLLVLAVIVIVLWPEIKSTFLALMPKHAYLSVVNEAGQPLTQGELEIFPLDMTKYRPSPLPRLAVLPYQDTDLVELGTEHMPQEALVRVKVPGYGVDYTNLELGQKSRVLMLGPPISIAGSVKTTAGHAVEGATVIGMGGDPRGVVLAETRSDAKGNYSLEGISALVPFLYLRVLKEGFALQHREWRPKWREGVQNTDFELLPVPPARGWVLLPESISPEQLTICVYNLPGVMAKVKADGSFALHHLEPNRRYRVVVYNLPRGYTHRLLYVRSGEEDVVLTVTPAMGLEGQVVYLDNGKPVALAEISHEHSPRGLEFVRCDENGRFTLKCLPPGVVSLHVKLPERAKPPEGGHRAKLPEGGHRVWPVNLKAGGSNGPVVIKIH